MSPQPLGGALSGSFQEPASSDPTSAPAESVPTGPSGSSNIAKTLAKRKKGFGPGVKNPTDLGRAIAMAKKAHQGSHKYG